MIVISGPWAQEVFPDIVFPREVFPKINEYGELGDPVKEFEHGYLVTSFERGIVPPFEHSDIPTDFDALEHVVDFDEVIT